MKTKIFAEGNLIQSIEFPDRIAYCLSSKQIIMLRVNKNAMDYVGDKYETCETHPSRWQIFSGKVEALETKD